jgi:hypothetical protein
MYAALLTRLADDIDAGGPARAVLAGHEGDPGPSALALRLLGSVHRLVLSGRAPELEGYYPSVGGTFAEDETFAALRGVLSDRSDEVRQWLDRPPQTNEVGRAATLYGGLLQLPWDLPVRLFEIGASGGLNLRADRYAYETVDGVVGDAASPVLLAPAWAYGPADRPTRIVERSGCDIAPVDVLSVEGRLTLASYVWPDQVERLTRLTAAMDVAAQVPAHVDRTDALTFVRGIDLEDGAVTVLWHSVMFQYLTPADRAGVRARIEELGALATDRGPFVHLFFEPTRRTPDSEHEFLVSLEVWPGGTSRVLGRAHPHGLPVTWE